MARPPRRSAVPIPGIEVQVRDEIGEVLEAGRHGELWVRGPQVSGEYEGLGSVLDADGWACAVTTTNGEGSGIGFASATSAPTSPIRANSSPVPTPK